MIRHVQRRPRCLLILLLLGTAARGAHAQAARPAGATSTASPPAAPGPARTATADDATAAAIDVGFDLLHHGDRAGAYQQFERLAAASPHDLAVTHGLLWALDARLRWEPGLAAAYEHRLDQFIDEAEARQQRLATDMGARFYLAQGYMLRARYRIDHDKGVWSAARDAARARSHIDAYLQRHPAHGDAYYALGLYNYYVDIAPTFVKFIRTLLFLPSGSRAKGLEQLQRAATTGRWLAAPAREALLEIYGRYENRPDLARAAADPLLAQYPDNLEFRLTLADTLAHPAIEEYAPAADVYTTVIARARAAGTREPPALTARAQIGLASALLHVWRLDEAIAALTAAIDAGYREPRWAVPQARLMRALCRGILGDAAEADRDIQAILDTPALQPWHAAATGQRERLARLRTSGEGAVLLELLPGNRAVAEGRLPEAREVYTAIAARHPQDWQVKYRLARLTIAEGHLEDARARFAAVVDAPKDRTDWMHVDAMLWLARTYDLLGRRDDALALYKRVVAEAPGGDARPAARTGLLTPYRAPSR